MARLPVWLEQSEGKREETVQRKWVVGLEGNLALSPTTP